MNKDTKIAIVICLGIWLCWFVVWLCGVSHADEIVTAPLSKTPVPITEAAELTGYTGCIDSAYRIAHVVCIVDGDTDHCVSVGKRSRGSGKKTHGLSFSESTPLKFYDDNKEELPIGLRTYIDQDVWDGLHSSCKDGDDFSSDKITRCMAAGFSELGAFLYSIDYINYLGTIRNSDLLLAEQAIEGVLDITPKNDREIKRIKKAEDWMIKIRKRFETE